MHPIPDFAESQCVMDVYVSLCTGKYFSFQENTFSRPMVTQFGDRVAMCYHSE